MTRIFHDRCARAGSPRLHRALFRDKCSSSQSQHRRSARSGSQSPGDSGISQSHSSFSGNSPSQTLSQSVSSVSSISDWSPDTPSNISKVLARRTIQIVYYRHYEKSVSEEEFALASYVAGISTERSSESFFVLPLFSTAADIHPARGSIPIRQLSTGIC